MKLYIIQKTIRCKFGITFVKGAVYQGKAGRNGVQLLHPLGGYVTVPKSAIMEAGVGYGPGEKLNPIQLTIGLKQFGSEASAFRWIDRKEIDHPTLNAYSFHVNKIAEGCHEVVVVIPLNLPENKDVEFSMGWAF